MNGNFILVQERNVEHNERVNFELDEFQLLISYSLCLPLDFFRFLFFKIVSLLEITISHQRAIGRSLR